MGVAQHHDAVSGTEKQQVAFDYAQRLSQGIDAAEVSEIHMLTEWTVHRNRWLTMSRVSSAKSMQNCCRRVVNHLPCHHSFCAN